MRDDDVQTRRQPSTPPGNLTACNDLQGINRDFKEATLVLEMDLWLASISKSQMVSLGCIHDSKKSFFPKRRLEANAIDCVLVEKTVNLCLISHGWREVIQL